MLRYVPVLMGRLLFMLKGALSAFANMKLLLEHREENIRGFLQGRTNYNQFLVTCLKYTRRTVAIHFHSSHPQPSLINTSFCPLVGLLLTKLNHYFNDSTDSTMFFGHSK